MVLRDWFEKTASVLLTVIVHLPLSLEGLARWPTPGEEQRLEDLRLWPSSAPLQMHLTSLYMDCLCGSNIPETKIYIIYWDKFYIAVLKDKYMGLKVWLNVMWYTFSWGDTVEGIWPCSFSVSQFLRASSSHSACILSQNSVSDWKTHLNQEELNINFIDLQQPNSLQSAIWIMNHCALILMNGSHEFETLLWFLITCKCRKWITVLK